MRLRRRELLKCSGLFALGVATGGLPTRTAAHSSSARVEEAEGQSSKTQELLRLFLCGDVMTGRGIDQVLPHPTLPDIHERYVTSALGYVELAERINGPIPRPVAPSYIWGVALDELSLMAPDARIINLETSVTTNEEWMPKGINYRMHPENATCITAANIDCCVLANNHVLDWGYAGLQETLQTLKRVGVETAGAGLNLKEAEAPAVLNVPGKGRVLVFSFGSVTSGIPPEWAASMDKPGVNLLADLSDRTVQTIARQVHDAKRPGDVAVASIHWGGNWGYEISSQQKDFAHKLIDLSGVDIVHGHSSHHAKGIEVYRGKPIIYGCGDFLNDYEGISGYEEYRDDLALMYFLTMDPSDGTLSRLDMTPLQIRRFRLNRVSRRDAQWMSHTLTREGAKLGTRTSLRHDSRLTLQWD